MKRIIYLVIILITACGFQSCNDFKNPFLESDNTSSGFTNSSTSENEDGQNLEEKKDSANATVVAAVAKNDSIIKALSDSISYLSTSIEGYDNKIKELNSEITTIKKTSIGVKSFFIYLTIYTLVIILLVLFLVNKRSMSKKHIKGYIHEKLSGDDKSGFNLNHVVGRLNKVEQTQCELKSNISNLECKIQNIITSLRNSFANQQQNYNPRSTEYSGNTTGYMNTDQSYVKKEPNKIPDVFYFEQPSNDREFDDRERKIRPTEYTLYKFTLLKNKQDEAEFIFEPLQPNLVNYALNVRNKKIDPVCDTTVNGNSGKFHCNPGQAKLKDGKWIVTKTAFITFD